MCCLVDHHIDGLVQERRNSIANALELRLYCTYPLIWPKVGNPSGFLKSEVYNITFCTMYCWFVAVADSCHNIAWEFDLGSGHDLERKQPPLLQHCLGHPCNKGVIARMGSRTNVIHYSDVIMDAMASQITSPTIVYSTVYSSADQRKHQSSASLAFVWGIHRWSVNSPHKWPVTRKMFPFDDVIMHCNVANLYRIPKRCRKWSW